MTEQTEQFEETIACLSCLAPNRASADFCEKCGAPIGTTATLDPLKMIRAEGFAIERATTAKKPSLIVLIGVWLLFLPFLPAGAFLAVSQFSAGFGFQGFVFFWLGVGLGVFGAVILYRVSKNYFAPQEAIRDEN